MDLAGETLGQYQIIEELGKGGMATVYKAYQPNLQRYVAIKVLSPALAEDLDLVKRFLREARLRCVSFRGQGLFQAGSRLRLTRRVSLPLVPHRFQRWFFRKVEPALREGPLLRVMGTLQARVAPGGQG